MKNFIIAGTFTLLNATFQWVPSGSLFVVVLAAMILDFITGVIKAIFAKEQRTSEGYRRTIVKFTQYGGAILVSMILNYMVAENLKLQGLEPYISNLTNGVMVFILFIETTSVLENISEIDNKTPFSKYCIKPLLKILTFQIKKFEQEK